MSEFKNQDENRGQTRNSGGEQRVGTQDLKQKGRVPIEEMEIEKIDLGGDEGKNDDPRRLRILNRLRGGKTPPPVLGGNMQRKMQFEQKRFEERTGINPRMQRKLDFEQEQFEKRGGSEGKGNALENEAPKRLPPAPPKPLALPNDPTDAVAAIRKAAVAARDALRHAGEQLFAVKEDFVALQKERSEGKNGAGERMNRMVEGVRGVLDNCEVELHRLGLLRDQLAQVQVNAPNAPPALKPLHQKATGEIAIALQQGQPVFDEGMQLLDKLQSACDGKSEFKINDAMRQLYKPVASELPSLLRELINRLQELTPAFQDATRQLAPLLEEVTGLFAIAVKGGKLPDKTNERLDKIAQGSEAIAKPFSRWNGATIQPYRTISQLMKEQKDQIEPEVTALASRMGAAYDVYGNAFGAAGQANQKIAHLVNQLRQYQAPPVNGEEAAKALSKLREQVEQLAGGTGFEGTTAKPLTRLADKKQHLAERKKLPDPGGIDQLGPLQDRLVQVNRDVEAVVDSRLSLIQAQQQLAMFTTILTTRFANQKPLAQQVAALRKAIEQLTKKIGPVLTESERTEQGFRALVDGLTKRLDRIGPVATPEETGRLAGALASLPPPKGKDALFPANGAATAKQGLDQDGDPRGAKLFDAAVKAWAAVEKKADEKTLAALEKAANACIGFTTANKLTDPVDTGRADKCRDALRRMHELQLEQARAGMPEPPWSEDQAREGRRIEAQTLLLNGGEAKPPSGKGESDSFFLKNSSGKPAFIFKPMQGENVKEGGRPGQGVAREVLSSKFNDQMTQMMGLDFGVCPTGLARLDSPSFAQGTLSDETSRFGALQQTAPNSGNLSDLCGKNADPNACKAIPTEDVQKIAILDFLTLQGDRNPENLLVRDEGGKKRLTPIDGGFAFPGKKDFAKYSVGMEAGSPGEKSGTVRDGNGLMQLPQSDEKFTPEMLKAIEKLDPAGMVKGMKQANKDLVAEAPELDGMVGDENLENMRRSAVFLKKVAPEFTVAELGQAYARDFKKLLDLPANKLEAGIAEIVETMRARRGFDQDVVEKRKQYEQLGGDRELVGLGWSQTDMMLAQDWNRKIKILREKIPAPKEGGFAAPRAGSVPEEQYEQKYKALGGDKMLAKVLQRPDARFGGKLTTEDKLAAKLGRLRHWEYFQDNGGDAELNRVVELYERNRYSKFDDLQGEAKAAVIVVSGQRSDPLTTNIMIKGTLLATFAALKRHLG
ncbi:MAG: hypothetical protein KGI51_00535 [Rhodospirillales bacterium]|nr:hypothetical protein [Rhodospirillales bacterium]